jgi:hypothetical protein
VLSAEQRLAVLLAERDAIEHELAAHRSQREELLRQDKLTQITELAAADDQLRLRLEAIDARLPDVQAAVYAARRAAHEATRQEHRPALSRPSENWPIRSVTFMPRWRVCTSYTTRRTEQASAASHAGDAAGR